LTLGLDEWTGWILIGGSALFFGNVVVEIFTNADEEE
jgi:uncharacterized membrane protein YgdD (TMEM256/DUF423 family)